MLPINFGPDPRATLSTYIVAVKRQVQASIIYSSNLFEMFQILFSVFFMFFLQKQKLNFLGGPFVYLERIFDMFLNSFFMI